MDVAVGNRLQGTGFSKREAGDHARVGQGRAGLMPRLPAVRISAQFEGVASPPHPKDSRKKRLNKRISRMRMRKRVHWDDLRRDARWQQVVSLLPIEAMV